MSHISLTCDATSIVNKMHISRRHLSLPNAFFSHRTLVSLSSFSRVRFIPVLVCLLERFDVS